MYLLKEMMHNKFVQVRIPKPSEIFGRCGLRAVNPSGYTGDEKVNLHQTKLDILLEEEERYKAELSRIAKEREESRQQ